MQYILSILPFLACPVGMDIMMWVMMRGNQSRAMNNMGQGPADTQSGFREVESRSTLTARTPDEQLTELKACLSLLQFQQQVIASEIAELDGAPEYPRAGQG